MAREQRKLAAIVAADVVGYSRLMGRDESGTLARLRKNRAEHLDPVLAKYGGRLVKLTGDGALVEFGSAVDALSAAIEFQQAMAEAKGDQAADTALVFRMGLHLGDLIVDGDDLYGDGVNIAARLEAEAPAGGIVISRTVHEAVAGRLKATFDDLGSLALKNIERPVQAFGVKWESLDWQRATPEVAVGPATALQISLPLPDKPSIAVLPFQNMSGEPEQEYFADGMVEEIITALSRFKSLFVIARNSSFTYKGKAVDIRAVGRELGVRYVLEGSVRKAGGRVRITGQLIDSATGIHLWADRFESSLDDIFELQDQMTTSVVAAVAPRLDQMEIERAKLKPAENLDAYDCLLRGIAHSYVLTENDRKRARRLFYRAIELDPGYAAPYGWSVRTFADRPAFEHTDADKAEVKRLASRVAAIGHDDAVALCWAGFGLFRVHDDDAGMAMMDQALALNQNLAAGWFVRGWCRLYRGEHELGLEELTRGKRLSPLDPDVYRTDSGIAFAHLFQGRYDEAVRWANRSSTRMPTWMPALRAAAAAHALAGNIDEARKVTVGMRQLEPARTISHLKAFLPYRRPEDLARLIEGLRLAGLPE